VSIPYQNPVVAAVWLLAVADAVRQGVQLPQSDLVTLAGATGQLPSLTVVLGLIGPTLLLFLNLAMSHAFPGLSPLSMVKGLSRWVDSRWGEGSLAEFLLALRPVLLVAVALCTMGTIGLLSARSATTAPFASQVASFALASGIGFAVARVVAKRWFSNALWV
jgi:hypothetical protein